MQVSRFSISPCCRSVLTEHEAIGQVGGAGSRVAGGGRGVEPDCQQQLEVEGNDVGSQAKDWQQGSIHGAQPHQCLVLNHLNHNLQQPNLGDCMLDADLQPARMCATWLQKLVMQHTVNQLMDWCQSL